MTKNIWICAGGTGGHISPAIALTSSFSQKNVPVIFFTLPKNINYPGIRKKTKKLIEYPASPIPKNLTSALKFLKDIVKTWKILNKEYKENEPFAMIGMGGYPCFAPLLWALWKRVPYYLCEQNAVLGSTTYIFSYFAKAVFLSFPVDQMKKNFVFFRKPLSGEEFIFHPQRKTFQCQ